MSWWEQTAATIGVVGGALLVLVAVFRTVPPFKQVARFCWRRLVSQPLHESFKRAVTESNRDTIRVEVRKAANKAIGQAVPGAVQRSFESKVTPRLDEFQTALVEHMRVEEASTERDQQFRDEVLTRLAAQQRATYEVEGRVESIGAQVGSMGDRVESLERTILEGQGVQLEGHMLLTPKVPESSSSDSEEGTG